MRLEGERVLISNVSKKRWNIIFDCLIQVQSAAFILWLTLRIGQLFNCSRGKYRTGYFNLVHPWIFQCLFFLFTRLWCYWPMRKIMPNCLFEIPFSSFTSSEAIVTLLSELKLYFVVFNYLLYSPSYPKRIKTKVYNGSHKKR